jgi:hypothetical protein
MQDIKLAGIREPEFQLSGSYGLGCMWSTNFCQRQRRRHVSDGTILLLFFTFYDFLSEIQFNFFWSVKCKPLFRQKCSIFGFVGEEGVVGSSRFIFQTIKRVILLKKNVLLVLCQCATHKICKINEQCFSCFSICVFSVFSKNTKTLVGCENSSFCFREF